MGYDLRAPRSDIGEVLCFVASSDMHCAAFGAINEHVVVVGSVTYFIHCLLQNRIVIECGLTTGRNCNVVHKFSAISLQIYHIVKDVASLITKSSLSDCFPNGSRISKLRASTQPIDTF